MEEVEGVEGYARPWDKWVVAASEEEQRDHIGDREYTSASNDIVI